MKNLKELLEEKRQHITLGWRDLVEESDSPNWRKRHPLGPVHVIIKCKLCGEVLADDLKGYGHAEIDSYWDKYLQPHFSEKH